MCSIPVLQSKHLVISDDYKYVGRRRCGHVSVSLSITSLSLHCLFCEFESDKLDLFLNHLKHEHLSLLAAENYWLEPEEDGVVAVKQEILEIAETNVLDDTDLIQDNVADPLMTNKKNFTVSSCQLLLKHESSDEHDDEDELPLSSIIETNGIHTYNSVKNSFSIQSDEVERPKVKHMLKLIDHLQAHPTLWNSQLRSRYIRTERQQEIEIITKKMQDQFTKVKIDSKYVLTKVNKLKQLYFNYKSMKNLTKNEKIFYAKLHFLNGHEPKGQEKKTECLLCHMMVTDMCKHMKKRHQENDIPQICKICEETQPSERHLRIHLRSVHRRYECEYCDDVYAALRTLHNHIRRVHIDKPPPPIHPRAKLPSDRTCEYCGRQFGSKQTLNNHKRFVHLQIRPYACSECGKAFKQKQKLNSHQNSVHLKRREHICNVCSKGFYDRKTLVQHMRLHSDVMNYVCNVCGKSFRQAPALHSHMKTHKS